MGSCWPDLGKRFWAGWWGKNEDEASIVRWCAVGSVGSSLAGMG